MHLERIKMQKVFNSFPEDAPGSSCKMIGNESFFDANLNLKLEAARSASGCLCLLGKSLTD